MAIKQRLSRKRRAKIVGAVFTVLGAAVVAVTFYIHDSKREQIRDFASSLSQAQAFAALNSQIWYLRPYVIELRTIVLRSVDPDNSSQRMNVRNIKNSKDTLGALEMETVSTHADAMAWSNVATILDGRISRTNQSRLDNLQVEETTETAEAGGISAEIETALQMSRGFGFNDKDPEFAKLTKKIDTDLASYWPHHSALADKFRQFSFDVQQQASYKLKESEEAAERYTTWSYYLYAFGFLLHLAGKLTGIGSFD